MRPLQSQGGEGLIREIQHQHQLSSPLQPNSFSELLSNNTGILSPQNLYCNNNQDSSLNSLLLQNQSNNNNGNLCMDPNIAIEKLLQQVEMLNHQSNIVAPPPPMNNHSQPPSAQQLTINMMDTKTTWKKSNVGGGCGTSEQQSNGSNTPTSYIASPNNFNQANYQLFQFISQQQQPSHVNIGMMDNSPEGSILQLLQSSLNNQRMVSKTQQPILNGNATINNLLSNQHLIGSMNHHHTSDVFSPSSRQTSSIIINPNDFSTQILHPSPQHASLQQMHDLLKPVDMSSNSDSNLLSFTSPTSISEPISTTTLLQQGSVEEMLGEPSRTNFASPQQESEEEKPRKGEKKKRTKKSTKEKTHKKPSKKLKKETQEISITVPQHNQQTQIVSSPTANLSISPNSSSNLTSANAAASVTGDVQDKKNEKFSRPLLKNETVLCENNKFKNNYFVFSGTPLNQGSKKKSSRTHSISSSVLSDNQGTITPVSSSIAVDSHSVQQTGNGMIGSELTLSINNISTTTGSKSPLPENLTNNKWASFIATLSESDKHSLMQAIIESMIKK